ncbi:TPA: hypothetical protein I7716_21250 [Vibrio vulnificus]|nr:hypothetical protein [Vibrio vulnificus]
MARKYWSDEDYTQGSKKTTYLRDYNLKNGLNKGLRKVEVDRLDELLGELDLSHAIGYFETLPDNFKKCFKAAYRQQVKREKSGGRGKQIEVSSLVAWEIDQVLEMLAENSPDELERFREAQKHDCFRELTLRDAVLYHALREFGILLHLAKGKEENEGKSLIDSLSKYFITIE